MVYPKSNAPQEMQPWVKQIQSDVQSLKGGQSRIESNVASQIAGVSSAAQSAASDASSAIGQNNATQQELNQLVSSALKLPGDNLFDIAPLTNQDISGYNVTNHPLDTYSWVTGGIQVTIPSDATSGYPIDIWNKDVILINGGGVGTLSFRFDYTLSTASGGTVWMLFDWRDANGNVVTGSTSASGGSEASETHFGAIPVPAGAVSLRLGMRFTRATGQSTSITGTLVNPYATLVIPSSGVDSTLSDKNINRGSLQGRTSLDNGYLSIQRGAFDTYDPFIEFRNVSGTLLWRLDGTTLVPVNLIPIIPTSKLSGSITNDQLASGIDANKLAGTIPTSVLPAIPYAEYSATVTPANDTVTFAGTYSYDSANSNNSSFTTYVSNGVIRLNQAGVYTIVMEAAVGQPITNRSFIDIETQPSGSSTWTNRSRVPIPNSEDRVSNSRPLIRATSANMLVRFSIYRRVATPTASMTTRVTISRTAEV